MVRAASHLGVTSGPPQETPGWPSGKPDPADFGARLSMSKGRRTAARRRSAGAYTQCVGVCASSVESDECPDQVGHQEQRSDAQGTIPAEERQRDQVGHGDHAEAK